MLLEKYPPLSCEVRGLESGAYNVAVFGPMKRPSGYNNGLTQNERSRHQVAQRHTTSMINDGSEAPGKLQSTLLSCVQDLGANMAALTLAACCFNDG